MKSLFQKYSTLIIISIILAVLFALLAWFGLKEGKRVSLKMMERDARSLSGFLISGCQRLFNAGIFAENEIGQLLKQEIELVAADLEAQKLNEIAQKGEFCWIVIIDKEYDILQQSYCDHADPEYLLSALPEVLIPIFEGKKEEMLFGIDPEFPFLAQPKGYAIKLNNRVLIAFADQEIFNSGAMKTGVGHLVREMAEEPAVKYLLLQNEEGIVFASRKVKRMSKISKDEFLLKILTHGGAKGRVTRFEGEEVYEYVRQFPKMGDFYGVLRMGFSLNEYNTILYAYKWEFIFFVVLLFFIAIISTTLIFTSRRFQAVQKLSASILSNMDAVCVAVNRRGNISTLNSSGEKFWGFSAQEVINRKYDSVFPADELNLKQVLDAQQSMIGIQKQIEAPTGLKTINLSATYLGKEGAFAIFEDITNLLRLKEEVASREYLKTLSDLIASVAHEVRNPLNAISIACQRLGDEFEAIKQDQECKTLLHTVENEVRRVDKLVREFISLASPIAPNKKLQPFKELLEDLKNITTLEASQKGVNFTAEWRSLPQLYYDYESMKKALHNILKNAVEATSEGGEVRLSVKAGDNNIEVSVWDNGEPIKKELLEKIFKPFVSYKEKGTGLGLFVAFQTIREHKGEIKVDSKQEFTEFTITIPIGQ